MKQTGTAILPKILAGKLGIIDLTKRMEETIGYRVSTGNAAMDMVTGGGIPAARLTEIFGDFSSGKSRIACHILAETQKAGGIAVLVDNERSFDVGLARLTGLDIDNLIYPDPNEKLKSIEDVFGVMMDAVSGLREHAPEALLTIVWDSVAATPGMEDLENELGANTAAMRRAKVISDGLKKLMSEVYRHNICLVFINQLRDRIGIVYGEKSTTVGGRALKFTSSVRIHCTVTKKLKDKKTDEVNGFEGMFVVEKCKVGPPFGKVNFIMPVDAPIDRYSGLLDYLERHGTVQRSGMKYNFVGYKELFSEDQFPLYYEEWKKLTK
jgi:recombination protein RecA